MKSLLIIATILSASLFSNASCIGEAQIIAKVNKKVTDSMTYCRVTVSNVSFYKENMTCPLDLSEVMSYGIEIGLKNGHDCELDSDTITGVLVQNSAGDIYLEQ